MRLFFILWIYYSSIFIVSANQSGAEGYTELFVNFAQISGNVLANAAQGHSVVDSVTNEFEWMMIGSLKDIGADGLLKVMGKIPSNLLSYLCVQTLTPICKRMCSRFLSRSRDKYIISFYFDQIHSSWVRNNAIASVGDITFLKLLDKYGRDNSIFAFYSQKTTAYLKEILLSTSQDEEISLKAVDQLLKIGGIDLGLYNELLLKAADERNWNFVARLLQETFVNVSVNANKVLRLAMKDSKEAVITHILKHSSFDSMADGFSIVDWAADHDYLSVLGHLIADGFYKSAADLHRKRQIKLSLWAVRHKYKEIGPVDLSNGLVAEKSGKWTKLLVQLKNMDKSVSQNKNSLLKSLFFDYLGADMQSKPYLARLIVLTLVHKSFTLFRDSHTLSIFIKEFYSNQDLSERGIIGGWINTLLRHNSYIPSLNCGELLFRAIVFLPQADWRVQETLEWLHLLMFHDHFSDSLDKHLLVQKFFEAFLSTNGERKSVLLSWAFELLQNPALNPSNNGNILASKLLNSLPYMEKNEKSVIIAFINKIFDHGMFNPSNGANVLLMDLIEYFHILSSEEKDTIKSWIQKLVDHPNLKPSAGDNRILGRLLLEFKLAPLWQCKNSKDWIDKIISFSPHTSLNEFYSSYEETIGYKKMVIRGWIQKLSIDHSPSNAYRNQENENRTLKIKLD